jgi:hypothetical protein
MAADERKDRIDTGTEVRVRIEQALRTRSASQGTTVARIEHVLKRQGMKVWNQVKHRPSLGVAVAGGAGLALAMTIGVGELAVAILFGYGAYQVLREGVPPKVAVREVAEALEKL